jgi:hypothetical protein
LLPPRTPPLDPDVPVPPRKSLGSRKASGNTWSRVIHGTSLGGYSGGTAGKTGNALALSDEQNALHEEIARLTKLAGGRVESTSR